MRLSPDFAPLSSRPSHCSFDYAGQAFRPREIISSHGMFTIPRGHISWGRNLINEILSRFLTFVRNDTKKRASSFQLILSSDEGLKTDGFFIFLADVNPLTPSVEFTPSLSNVFRTGSELVLKGYFRASTGSVKTASRNS